MQATLKGLGLRGSVGASGAALSGAASAARHVLPGSNREHAVPAIDSAEVRGIPDATPAPLSCCTLNPVQVMLFQLSGHLRLVRGVSPRS